MGFIAPVIPSSLVYLVTSLPVRSCKLSLQILRICKNLYLQEYHDPCITSYSLAEVYLNFEERSCLQIWGLRVSQRNHP
jgi:hypothetical protein